MRDRVKVARRRRCAVLAVSAALAAGGVLGQTMAFHEAFNAIKTGDCAKAGEIVNRGIDARTGEMLYLAGTMLEQGLCVASNLEQARVLYAAAAKAGDAGAARRLGQAYAVGEAVPQSYRHAAALFSHAAALSDPERAAASRDLSLPPSGDSVDIAWHSYLIAASNMLRRYFFYTPEMGRIGSQGSVRLRICPAADGAEFTVVSRSESQGTVTAPAEIVAETKRGAAELMKEMPPPRTAGLSQKSCGEMQLDFRRKKWGQSTQ